MEWDIKIKTDPNRAPLVVQVVKNPCNAGDTGSMPGPGRPHMLQGNEALEPQKLRPHEATNEARGPRAGAPQLEKPVQRGALQPDGSPGSLQLDKSPRAAMKTQCRQ